MSKPFTLQDLKQSAVAAINQHLFGEVTNMVKRAKYGNNKVEWEGLIFDSKKEYKRYRELLVLLKNGGIGQLRRQVPYLLIDANEKEKKCDYYADYVYVTAEGLTVVEDVKSVATRKLPTYIIKRKLMKDKYGIEINEV